MLPVERCAYDDLSYMYVWEMYEGAHAYAEGIEWVLWVSHALTSLCRVNMCGACIKTTYMR